jgi:histone acetyltransferase (RNA polymerase elongator complex component)
MPRARILPVFVPHLGCPHHCVFCDQNRITGRGKPADAAAVRQTVEEALRKNPGVRGYQLAFYGGSFTAIPEKAQQELLDAAVPYLRCGVLSSLRLSTRPDAIDAPTLERLRRAGVTVIELGAQSLDDRVLRAAGRGHTAEQVRTASRAVQKAGFSLVLQMMTGLPEQSADSAYSTALEMASLRPNGVRIYPTVIVRGTELYDRWKAGIYPEHTVEEAVRQCARIVPIFEQAGIPILRLGLNPTEDLSGGEAVAGAYHPALGEMVRSRMLLEQMEKELAGVPAGGTIHLYVNTKTVSKAVGQHRQNLRVLQQRFRPRTMQIHRTDIPDNTVRVRYEAPTAGAKKF